MRFTKKEKKVSYTCVVCGKSNRIFICFAKTRKFCNRKCQGIAKRGTKHTSETIEKIRQASINGAWGFKKGHKVSLGKKHTEEAKKKMSLTRKYQLSMGIVSLGIHKGMLGKHHTPETIEKMRLANKKPNAGQFNSDNNAWTKYKDKILAIRRMPEYREKISGKNSYLWKGGVSTLDKIIRNSLEYKQWRLAVFMRDNFTCVDCEKVRGGKLQADHIKPFSIILRQYMIKSFEEALLCNEIWDISNGRTLCIPCHKETNTYARGALKYEIQIIQ